MKRPSPSAALWAAVTLAIIAAWIFAAMHWSQTAWDFSIPYVAAHVPTGSLYDQAVFQPTARRVLAGSGAAHSDTIWASPYLRPAVFALPLRWMRGMAYWEAFRVWAALEVLFYAATLWLLARRFQVPFVGCYSWLLFLPAAFGVVTGQDSLALGLVLTLALVMLEDGRDAIGGALLALTLYKFNVYLLLPVFLLLRRRYRALAAYAACGAILAGASVALEPPASYLALLKNYERYSIGFSPENMFGLRGLLLSLNWGAAYAVVAVALAVGLLLGARRMAFAQGFGLVMMAGVLLAYHAGWHDAGVLTIPFGLALAAKDAQLRLVAAVVMLIPFWDSIPAVATVLLLGFAVYYAAALRPTGQAGVAV